MHAIRAVSMKFVAVAAIVTSCQSSDVPVAPADGAPPDASVSAPDADAGIADSVAEQRPTSDGARPDDGAPLDVAVPPGDADCISCDPMGGQYCGVIGRGCSNGPLRCPDCRHPGFSCGGGGIPNVCGFNRDSGDCKIIHCSVSGATYCGQVGDGCGGTLDCGDCSQPQVCGTGGIPGVCGMPEDRCTRVTCISGPAVYCGVIGNGCGGILDCGSCPNGDLCGAVIDHMCGLDPPGILIPPPAPLPPPPPGPPPPPHAPSE